MDTHRALSAVVQLGFAAALCLLTVAPNNVLGQGTIPSAPSVKDPFGEVRERQQREAQLRSAEMVSPAKRPDTRDFESGAKQMREDFKAIQLTRNSVVRHLLSEKPLDYRFIVAQTEEIGKRAVRLKTHLTRESGEAAKEKKEETKSVELGDNQMKGALVAMCKRIDSFTENPLFKQPDVVDLPQAARAKRDLRDIILLSEGIVKLAEKLNKTPDK
jgi:hypothetical protein